MTNRDSYLEAIKIYKDLIAQQEDLIAIFPVNTLHMKELLKDLEALEIFKSLIFHNIKYVGFENAIKSYEALFNIGTISKEQLEKFKQWLEEEE